jgi:hypothetical protein
MARAWARTFVEGGQPQVPDERWVAVIGTWSMSRGASTVSSPRSPPADPWLVPSALASVLGPLRLPLSRLGRLFGRPTGAAGARQLRNYAHVIETGPALAVAVLKGAGGVHIWQPATLTAAEARGFPAIRLFVERAGANLGALSRMRRSSVQGGRRGISSRRTWPSSHAIRISRSQIVSSRHAISIADNFRSRTELRAFGASLPVPKSSPPEKRSELPVAVAIHHVGRPPGRVFWSEREQQGHSFASPLLKFPIVRPKLFGL